MENNNPKLIIVEGHLSHFCSNCDKCIVLRLNPLILKKRLKFHFSLSLLYQSRIIPTIKPSKHLKIHYFVVFLQVINKT